MEPNYQSVKVAHQAREADEQKTEMRKKSLLILIYHHLLGEGELDHAMLRRLEKRILVSLPSSPARQAMISHWLPPLSCTGGMELRTVLDYKALAKEMEGYSGSDIRLACKEATMRPVRKIFDALESHQDDDTDMPAIQLETVTTADFLNVIEHTKPSARNLMDRYTAWEREYQSV
ncbi:katanin p60 ATPase-containing subunit A-like 2 isoform X2 [Astatotilapia calliptera]|uniref:katanin p60 ATPase-containing subunit A-like 2 isoform X2 n=1 Tax=Astatotilapia calliptera TaxID=8154 RepID=UPI000E40EA83|nr:katanin p60 ATPase-containing subunit A-like 2 isoform X2 [Astatotilapia calliptera]